MFVKILPHALSQYGARVSRYRVLNFVRFQNGRSEGETIIMIKKPLRQAPSRQQPCRKKRNGKVADC